MTENQAQPSPETLFAECEFSAVHLETRDQYTPTDRAFLDWRSGAPIGGVERWRDWYELMRATTQRGVRVRRARVVSEPLSDFIRYEHELTAVLNVPSGEEVRWLPRRRASDLALPGNDFWLFDNRLVRFHYFSGVGDLVGAELVDDQAVARLCATAFEAVWRRAIPHERYTVG